MDLVMAHCSILVPLIFCSDAKNPEEIESKGWPGLSGNMGLIVY